MGWTIPQSSKWNFTQERTLTNEVPENGGPGDLDKVPEKCPNDVFENQIREYGVIGACEWFGYDSKSEFTVETIRILKERSDRWQRSHDVGS